MHGIRSFQKVTGPGEEKLSDKSTNATKSLCLEKSDFFGGRVATKVTRKFTFTKGHSV